MELGMIRKVDIDHEMQQSYLDYAMSVIVARALPDARDGLKPVQRRILYAMYDMGLRPDSVFKKSARIVGEVLGKYHPHGDVAVYEAMARMAQDFSMRYPMVDGQGNFGSVDGDPPAAMRYTEARLTSIATDGLSQIEKDTVDFSDNFDGTLREPTVLPAAVPYMLVNGASGIAVGMATNIPPHNLGEVVDALLLMLDQWEKLDDLAIQDLMRFVKGPDFPTGGIIIQDPQGDGLIGAYATGKGKVIVQARAHLEEMGRGRTRIIVTELPYMVNKSALIERIADLVRDGSIEGIADLRDESDRQGMRIVIEITKAVEPEKILQQLYRHTPMQSTFGINMLALVNGEPHLLTLKHALRVYIEHRLEVVRRRSAFDLAKAKARAHILEGLLVALKNLDEVIAIIRGSPDVDTARKRLIQRFKLSEIQAQAILDMMLRRLASLERKKIEDEYKEVANMIKDLEAVLKSPKKMRQMVMDELKVIKQTYSDRRRTQIVTMKEGTSIKAMLTTTDITPAQNVWVVISEDGRIIRTTEDIQPRLTGKDAPNWLLHTNTHHTLYLATDQGKAAAVAVHIVPEIDKTPEGVPVHKVSPLPEGEALAAAFTLPAKGDFNIENFLLTITRAGMVKKSSLGELPGPSAQPFNLVKVNEGDSLGWVRLTDGKAELFLTTSLGMSIRFMEDEVRPMGLVAAGVNGIKLSVGDELVGAELARKSGEVLLVASNGMTKRTSMDEFPAQGRYGQGVIASKLPKGVRLAGMMVGKSSTRVSLLFASAASRYFTFSDTPKRSRSVQGQTGIDIKPGDVLLGLVQFWDGVELFNLPSDAPAKEEAKPALGKNTPVKKEASNAGPGVKRGTDSKASIKAAAKAVQEPLFSNRNLQPLDRQVKPTAKSKGPAGTAATPVPNPEVKAKTSKKAAPKSSSTNAVITAGKLPAVGKNKTATPDAKTKNADKQTPPTARGQKPASTEKTAGTKSKMQPSSAQKPETKTAAASKPKPEGPKTKPA